MEYGMISKNSYLDRKKIKIYQTSLFQRGLVVFSLVFVIAIYGTILFFEPSLYIAVAGAAILLLIIIVFYFSAFRAYL